MPRKKKEAKPWWEGRTTRPLFEFCASPWTPEEFAVRDVDRTNFEGKFEKSRRMRLGLSLNAVQGSLDIPEVGEEIKNLENKVRDKSGKFGLSAIIRLGKAVTDTSFMDAADVVSIAKVIVDENQEMISANSRIAHAFKQQAVSKKDISTAPKWLENRIREIWMPSKVMAHIPTGMCLATSYGFLVVPKCDFDIAFRFSSTSQSRLQFAFDWNYLRNKIRIAHEQTT